MDPLITFLRAQLDKAEAAVIEYRDGHPGGCENFEGQGTEYYTEYDTCWLHIKTAEATPYRDVEFGLADIAAKREIIEEHKPVLKIVQWPDDQTGTGKALVCPRCQNAENDDDAWNPALGEAGQFPHENFVTSYVLAPCRTLRLLALPFAERPGYRDSWRP